MSVRRRRGEAGVVTSTVLVVASALAVLAVAGVTGGQVLVAHRQAGSAADLGALAGAVAIQRGEDACAAARRLVARSDARVRTCHVSAERVRLTVTVDLGVAGRRIGVSARAHAGPR